MLVLRFTRLAPLLVAAALASACALAPAAPAATVSVSGSTLNVLEESPEANRLTISVAGNVWTITDTARIPFAGGGCTRPATDRVTCTTTAVRALTITAGDEDDTVVLTPSVTWPATIRDGAGDDVVTGGAGADTLVMNAGRDTVSGGAGADTVDYSGRGAPLEVSLDGRPGDGRGRPRAMTSRRTSSTSTAAVQPTA